MKKFGQDYSGERDNVIHLLQPPVKGVKVVEYEPRNRPNPIPCIPDWAMRVVLDYFLLPKGNLQCADADHVFCSLQLFDKALLPCDEIKGTEYSVRVVEKWAARHLKPQGSRKSIKFSFHVLNPVAGVASFDSIHTFGNRNQRQRYTDSYAAALKKPPPPDAQNDLATTQGNPAGNESPLDRPPSPPPMIVRNSQNASVMSDIFEHNTTADI